MEEDSNKHLIVEKGVKYYSKHTLGCFDVINQAIPEVLSLINSIKWDVILSNPSVSDYHLTDYGCADGGTDLPLWK